MGKYRAIDFGINQTINGMIHLGMRKAEMVELIHEDFIENGGTEKEWEENKSYMISKNDYLRSIVTIETMRDASKPFIDYCKDNGIKKFEKVKREDLENYLKYRNSQGYSPHTLSRDLHFCNKIFKENIQKKEIGLPSRLTKNITKGRSGMPQNRPGLLIKCRDQLDMIRATGMRRSSVTVFTKQDVIYKDNEPVQIRLLEKGGKKRAAYILPSCRERVKEILNKAPEDGPVFKEFDRHCNGHYLRGQYAKELIDLLQDQKERGIAFYDREIESQGRISTHDQERYPNGFRGYSKEVCAEVSANLGHNRIEILKNYLYK